MKFSCTNNTLRALGSCSPENAKLEDVLAVIQDVLKDAGDETGKNVYELSVSPNAVLFWLAVSRAFLRMDVGSASGELSERQKSRLAEVRQSLESMTAEITNAEADMKNIYAEAESLEQKLVPLRAERERQKAEEAKIQELKLEVARLENDIEKARLIDPAAIEEKRSALLTAQSDNMAKLRELNDITASLNAVMEKEQSIDAEIAEAQRKLAGAQAEIDDKNAKLSSISEQYEAKMSELSEQLAKVNAANDCNNRELERRRAELEEKKTITRGFESNLAEIIKDIETRRLSNETLIKEIQDYRERLKEVDAEHRTRSDEADGVRAEVAALESGINSLNDEISRLGEQRQALIEENNNKRIMLTKNDPEVLRSEIEEMDRRIEENKAKCGELDAQKATLAEDERRLIEAQEALAGEIEQLSEKVRAAEEQNSEHDNALRELTEQHESYQKLFDSDKYKDEARRIESLRKAANIYADGVEKLLGYVNGQDSGGSDHDAAARLSEARSLLETQLRETQECLGRLRGGYISIIEKTENEVNQNAM